MNGFLLTVSALCASAIELRKLISHLYPVVSPYVHLHLVIHCVFFEELHD